MTRKEKLGHIIFALDNVMDMIDDRDINNSDEVEKLYCQVRDLKEQFEWLEEEE